MVDRDRQRTIEKLQAANKLAVDRAAELVQAIEHVLAQPSATLAEVRSFLAGVVARKKERK